MEWSHIWIPITFSSTVLCHCTCHEYNVWLMYVTFVTRTADNRTRIIHHPLHAHQHTHTHTHSCSNRKQPYSFCSIYLWISFVKCDSLAVFALPHCLWLCSFCCRHPFSTMLNKSFSMCVCGLFSAQTTMTVFLDFLKHEAAKRGCGVNQKTRERKKEFAIDKFERVVN